MALIFISNQRICKRGRMIKTVLQYRNLQQELNESRRDYASYGNNDKQVHKQLCKNAKKKGQVQDPNIFSMGYIYADKRATVMCTQYRYVALEELRERR